MDEIEMSWERDLRLQREAFEARIAKLRAEGDALALKLDQALAALDAEHECARFLGREVAHLRRVISQAAVSAGASDLLTERLWHALALGLKRAARWREFHRG